MQKCHRCKKEYRPGRDSEIVTDDDVREAAGLHIGSGRGLREDSLSDPKASLFETSSLSIWKRFDQRVRYWAARSLQGYWTCGHCGTGNEFLSKGAYKTYVICRKHQGNVDVGYLILEEGNRAALASDPRDATILRSGDEARELASKIQVRLDGELPGSRVEAIPLYQAIYASR